MPQIAVARLWSWSSLRFAIPCRFPADRFVAFGAGSVLVSESVCRSETATCLLQQGQSAREERKGRGSESGKSEKGRGQCKSLEQPLLVM